METAIVFGGSDVLEGLGNQPAECSCFFDMLKFRATFVVSKEPLKMIE